MSTACCRRAWRRRASTSALAGDRATTTRAVWPRRWTTSACSRWSCSAATASCSPTNWRRACTTPDTGPSRAARPSQFQNHLRAVLGLPLGDTRMLGLACMLNWIGAHARCRCRCWPRPAATGTTTASRSREGRKVGHATLRADDAAGARCGAAARRRRARPAGAGGAGDRRCAALIPADIVGTNENGRVPPAVWRTCGCATSALTSGSTPRSPS